MSFLHLGNFTRFAIATLNGCLWNSPTDCQESLRQQCPRERQANWQESEKVILFVQRELLFEINAKLKFCLWNQMTKHIIIQLHVTWLLKAQFLSITLYSKQDFLKVYIKTEQTKALRTKFNWIIKVRKWIADVERCPFLITRKKILLLLI